MERQYCASVFVINRNSLLLMYNNKLKKWLQPGGHINGFELPHETAIRECFEETGVEIELDYGDYDNPIPIAIEHYVNKVGDMIDFQYSAIPKDSNIELKNNEGNLSGWFSKDEMQIMGVDEEIIRKFQTLKNKHKKVLTRVEWNYLKKTE